MNTRLCGGKPLKRLSGMVAGLHRAEATVLMRGRSSLRDWRWAAGLMFLALRCEPPMAAAEAADTNAAPLTVEALVADIQANNPELNFYKAEIAATKGE